MYFVQRFCAHYPTAASHPDTEEFSKVSGKVVPAEYFTAYAQVIIIHGGEICLYGPLERDALPLLSDVGA